MNQSDFPRPGSSGSGLVFVYVWNPQRQRYRRLVDVLRAHASSGHREAASLTDCEDSLAAYAERVLDTAQVTTFDPDAAEPFDAVGDSRLYAHTMSLARAVAAEMWYGRPASHPGT